VVGADEIWRPQPPQAWGTCEAHGLAVRLPPWSSTAARWAACSRRPPPWILFPDFSSLRLARRPLCSSSRQYPVLELLLQKRAERPHGGRGQRAAEQQAGASHFNDSVQRSRVQLDQRGSGSSVKEAASTVAMDTTVKPLVDSHQEAFSSTGSSMAPLNAAEELTLHEVEREDLKLYIVEREESEWSILSFSSLRTDLSVELSEALEASDVEDRQAPVQRSDGLAAARSSRPRP